MKRLLIPDGLVAAVSYNPETGEFRYAADGHLRKAGDPCGHRRPGGYLFLSWGRSAYAAHRVAWRIMTGEQPPLVIDHVDRDPTNNRWANLRPADYRLSAQNRGAFANNTTGITGVYRHPEGWTAVLQKDGQRHYLGFFKSKSLAIAARAQAEKEHGYVDHRD